MRFSAGFVWANNTDDVSRETLAPALRGEKLMFHVKQFEMPKIFKIINS